MQDTEELNKILKRTPLDKVAEYIDGADTSITVNQYFEYYIEKHHLKKSGIIENSLLNRTYAYSILNGGRKGSRDELIALCIGAGMPIDEIQRVLSIAKEPVLYPRGPRDSIILACIYHDIYDIEKINEYMNQSSFKIIR